MLWGQLKYAFRALRLSPGFTAVAICTLAVGIGANTAMFTVVDGAMLKPLRYRDADRIVAVNTLWQDSGEESSRVTGGDLMDLREQHETFEAFSYYQGGEMGIQTAHAAEFVPAYEVDPDFFQVFNAPPVAGRQFVPGDAGRSAIVAATFAEQNFGSAEKALGETIRLENVAYQIVGVMPAWVAVPRQAQVWLAVSPAPKNQNRSGFNYTVVAKLRSGTSESAADARLSVLSARLAAAYRHDNSNKSFIVRKLRDQLAMPVAGTLYVLMGAVGLVLLIACANVANLMLARTTTRARELAVRAALGASRYRIILQLLSESLVLSVAALALGVLLAQAGARAVLRVSVRFLPASRMGDIQLDWRVLVFAAAASVVTTVLFGLAPAWQASQINPYDALKQGGSRGAIGASRSRLRNGLVVAQVALSFVLAIGAGLLFRSFLSLNETDLGFRQENLLITYAHAPAAGSLSQENGVEGYLRAGQFFDDLFARLRELPSVVSAAGVMGMPTGQYDSSGSFAVEGRHDFNQTDWRTLPTAGFRLASPGYFQTLGVPLLSGRDFNSGDTYDQPAVVIVSEALAKKDFLGEDPIGHRIMCGLDRIYTWMTVIGVVADVRQYSPGSLPAPELYMPLRQHPYAANEVQVIIRANRQPDALVQAVQRLVREMNPGVATKFTTMQASVSDSIATPRFRMLLAVVFAVLAILLAGGGMYGVLSYLTAQRTSEFGVRMALGARPGDVLRLVLSGALKLVLIGVAAGTVLALAGSRLLTAMLFGVKSNDPLTYMLVLLLLTPLVVLAGALPAFRAARIDPMVALREE